MLQKSKNHLENAHESYGEHLCFASHFGIRMIGGGIAAILHGLCPALFQHTGSKTLLNLYDEIKARQLSHTKTPPAPDHG